MEGIVVALSVGSHLRKGEIPSFRAIFIQLKKLRGSKLWCENRPWLMVSPAAAASYISLALAAGPGIVN
jgi:hypothetical protein